MTTVGCVTKMKSVRVNMQLRHPMDQIQNSYLKRFARTCDFHKTRLTDLAKTFAYFNQRISLPSWSEVVKFRMVKNT